MAAFTSRVYEQVQQRRSTVDLLRKRTRLLISDRNLLSGAYRYKLAGDIMAAKLLR